MEVIFFPLNDETASFKMTIDGPSGIFYYTLKLNIEYRLCAIVYRRDKFVLRSFKNQTIQITVVRTNAVCQTGMLIFAAKYACMNEKLTQRIGKELEEIMEAGLFKTERLISSPQGAEIVVNNKTVLNFCANNYLG